MKPDPWIQDTCNGGRIDRCEKWVEVVVVAGVARIHFEKYSAPHLDMSI